MTTFGERLKQLREENRLTQQELADSIKITRSAIGNYENGKREPTFEMLEEFADYFNVDMDYMLGKSQTERKTPVTPKQMDAFMIDGIEVELAKARKLSTPAKECLDLFEAAPQEVRDFVLSILRQSSQIPLLRQ